MPRKSQYVHNRFEFLNQKNPTRTVGAITEVCPLTLTFRLYALLPARRQRTQTVVVILDDDRGPRVGPRLELRVQKSLVSLLHDMLPLPLPLREVLQTLRIRSLPRRRPGVMIHIVHPPPRIPPHLPSRRKRLRPLPRRRPTHNNPTVIPVSWRPPSSHLVL